MVSVDLFQAMVCVRLMILAKPVDSYPKLMIGGCHEKRADVTKILRQQYARALTLPDPGRRRMHDHPNIYSWELGSRIN